MTSGCVSEGSKVLHFDPTAIGAARLRCEGEQTSNYYPMGERKAALALLVEPASDASDISITDGESHRQRSRLFPCRGLSRCEVIRDGDILKIESANRNNGLEVGNFSVNMRTGEMKTGAGGLDGGWGFQGKCVPDTDAKAPKKSEVAGHLAILSMNEADLKYSESFFAAHRRIWPVVERKCSSDATRANLESFEALIVIDRMGRATDFFTLPNSPYFDCFRQNLIGVQYPRPPSSPFFQPLTVNLHKARL